MGTSTIPTSFASYVVVSWAVLCLANSELQLGVSIPENTRETPVMIVSELCSNGDLFDYIRNVNPPSLYRVVCIHTVCKSYPADHAYIV